LDGTAFERAIAIDLPPSILPSKPNATFRDEAYFICKTINESISATGIIWRESVFAAIRRICLCLSQLFLVTLSALASDLLGTLAKADDRQFQTLIHRLCDDVELKRVKM
jgi:hypothetical protein